MNKILLTGILLGLSTVTLAQSEFNADQSTRNAFVQTAHRVGINMSDDPYVKCDYNGNCYVHEQGQDYVLKCSKIKDSDGIIDVICE